MKVKNEVGNCNEIFPPRVSVVTMWFSQEVLSLSQPSFEIKLRYLRSRTCTHNPYEGCVYQASLPAIHRPIIQVLPYAKTEGERLGDLVMCVEARVDDT